MAVHTHTHTHTQANLIKKYFNNYSNTIVAFYNVHFFVTDVKAKVENSYVIKIKENILTDVYILIANMGII